MEEQMNLNNASVKVGVNIFLGNRKASENLFLLSLVRIMEMVIINQY
jgi:hypothetical protein